MYKLKTKYEKLGEENRKTYFIGKNEETRQRLRKERFKITRFLDNYYRPISNNKRNDIERRVWYPNGKYQVKRRYNETEIGLEHFYEKNNVKELEDIENSSKKENIENEELKYNKSKTGKYIITIEYCSQCDLHSEITQHKEETFKNIAINYQKIIQERFPFIQVILKPIDVDILKHQKLEFPIIDVKGNHLNNKKINDKFKQCKIGAFEIIMFFVDENGIKKEPETIIHSKLKKKSFPQITKVLERIASSLPKFTLNIVLFDKENYVDINKMNDIHVTIYLFKSNIIKDVSDEVNYEILNMLNPKFRLENLKTQRFLEKSTPLNFEINRSLTLQNFYRNNLNRNFSRFRKKNILKKFTENKNKDPNDKRGTFIGDKISKVENLDNENKNEEEKKDIRSISVNVPFPDLKYDTYLIETKENANFLPSLTLLKFDSLPNNNEYVKHIGLFHQVKSILVIYLYLEIDDKNPIKTAKITLTDINNPSIKFIIPLNNEGYYKFKTEPGEYKLEIYNKDCEKKTKKITLIQGYNELVEKLFYQKPCHLNLEICELVENDFDETQDTSQKNNDTKNNEINNSNENNENKDKNENQDKNESNNENKENIDIIPICNAEIKIFENPDTLLVEGLSNKKGNFSYLIGKDDNNLTIIINKFGYFPAERYFSRNDTLEIVNNEFYTFNMNFVLVKQSLLSECNKILFLSYMNTNSKIFELEAQNDDAKNNKIINKDFQKEKGYFLSYFSYIKNEKNYKEEEEEEENEENKKVEEEVEEENNKKRKIIQNGKDEEFDEETKYEEIIRLGLKINSENLKKKEEEESKLTIDDIITNLRKLCCSCIIYTSRYAFTINLPKFYRKEEKEEYKYSLRKISYDNEISDGLYWDIGWVDPKYSLFYETSIFTDLNNIFHRTLFFEYNLVFIQKFIDKKLYLNIFEYFGFRNSNFIENDRFLNKDVFIQCCNNLFLDQFNNENENNQGNEKILKKKFLEFLSNIMCGYDKENNILDDSISLFLLKKKISSNLKNFQFLNEDSNQNSI